MSTAQRSKTGCWTCRLRRKKCNEGGLPCSNCEARGIFCHGYGPKPPWKDRGEKEREQAYRVRLQSRTTQSRSNTMNSDNFQQSSASSALIDNPSSNTGLTTPDIHSPLQADFSISSLSPSQDRLTFDFLDGLELHGSLDAPEFADLLWPSLSSSSTEALVSLAECQPPTRELRPGPAVGFPFVAVAEGPDVEEREMELVMHFLGETFALQHASYRAASTMQRSWLLSLLMRSRTFYYTSLSMSAYHCFLALSADCEARGEMFQHYQTYRNYALGGFYGLLETDRPSVSTSTSLLGECMICGVQIALLDALGKNTQDSQSHLTSATQSLLNHEELMFTDCASFPRAGTSSIPPQFVTPTESSTVATSNPSPMAWKALGFFRALLVWNDVLSCSTRNTAPLGAEAYRKLLADEKFAQSFRDIVGCESWILVTIMDATCLGTWKRNQEAQGTLSIRELVSRAGKIESILEQGIEKLSTILQIHSAADMAFSENIPNDSLHHVQTYIFAHSVLTHIHTIVSGPLPGVPEIQKSVDRAISAWKLGSSSINLKALTWPYCVSASLAVGSQRDMFRTLISNSSSKEPTPVSCLQLKSVVEECWRVFDGRKSDRDAACDWKEVMERLNLNILLAYS